MHLSGSSLVAVLFLLASCGAPQAAEAPAAPTVTPPERPASTGRPTTTSRPMGDWVTYALPDGSAEARMPQAPQTEPLDDGGGALVWAEWDGAGFAIANPAGPVTDDQLSQLAATAAAAVLDGLFGVERGTVAATDLTVVSAPGAAGSNGAWSTRSLRLVGHAMGQKVEARCRVHRKGAQVIVHLLG